MQRLTFNPPGAIMTQIHQLFQLQKLDTEIDDKKKRLGEVLKAQKEPPALLAARHRADNGRCRAAKVAGQTPEI
jgi:hypothetical protein